MIRVALIIALTAALVLLLAGLILDCFTDEWELARWLLVIGSSVAAFAALAVLLTRGML